MSAFTTRMIISKITPRLTRKTTLVPIRSNGGGGGIYLMIVIAVDDIKAAINDQRMSTS